jgi:hypothetical protein
MRCIDQYQLNSLFYIIVQIVSVDMEVAAMRALLQTQILVLLRTFRECDNTFNPDKMKLGVLKVMESDVQTVEVVWRGKLERRFFAIPRICNMIGEEAKKSLVENVDRSNEDNKLLDFTRRIHDVYHELKWAQYLSEIGISRFVNRENLARSTLTSFALALLTNFIFM